MKKEIIREQYVTVNNRLVPNLTSIKYTQAHSTKNVLSAKRKKEKKSYFQYSYVCLKMKFERMEAGRDTRCKSRWRKKRKHYGTRGERESAKKGRNPEKKTFLR